MPRRVKVWSGHGSAKRRKSRCSCAFFTFLVVLSVLNLKSVFWHTNKPPEDISQRQELEAVASLLYKQANEELDVDGIINQTRLRDEVAQIVEKSLDEYDWEAALVRWLEQNVDLPQLLDEHIKKRTRSGGDLELEAPNRQNEFPEFLPNTVLFTITNKGYTRLAKNLITSLEKLKLGKYLVVVSYEPAAIKVIEEFDSFSGKTLLLGKSKATKWAAHSTEEFKENGSKSKLKALRYFLEKGINVFYIDGDIVVLRDFRDAFTGKDLSTMDVIIQDDYNVLLKKRRFVPCTGFMYIKYSQKTLKCTDLDAHDLWWKEAKGDQMYLRNFLILQQWKVKLLPQADFPNGSYLYNRIGTKEALWANKPYIVHVNYVVGGTKLTKLREYGILFYDEKEKQSARKEINIKGIKGKKSTKQKKSIDLKFSEFLPNTVLLTITNTGFSTMVKNLITSLERLGLGLYLIVATFEVAAKRSIESMEGFSGETLLLGHEDASEWMSNQTAQYKSIASKKFLAIKRFLSEGVDVLYIDGDVAVLRDFREAFPRDDLYTYDAIVQDDNDYKSQHKMFVPGTGLMWLKSAPRSLNALDLESHSKWWKEADGGQSYLINFLRRWKVKRLPLSDFPNGAYLIDKIKTKEALAEERPYIVHMNMVQGKEKLEKHREFGTLFYDQEETSGV